LGKPGNIGITGHGDGFFGLKDVTVSDGFELRTLTGSMAHRVGQVSIVAPEDASVLGNERYLKAEETEP
jgi:sortase (surface protein transpeptidase)